MPPSASAANQVTADQVTQDQAPAHEVTDAACPTGAQWILRRKDDQLTVTEVGGGLRTWTRGGVDVVAGFAADAQVIAGRGQQLIPWPNRIEDGRYTFDDTDHLLALTEPVLHNASHGLVRWVPWQPIERTEDSLTVALRLHPQPGWSWVLDLETRYALTDSGLVVTTSATNRSTTPAPFGYGAHPYLSLADTPLDAVSLTIPGSTYLEVDPDRLLPVRTHPVEGTAYDFRHGRPIGKTALDTAFTDLGRDDEGCWHVTVSGVPHGRLALWGDPTYPWLQVFTGRATAATEGTNGLAVEPMTCPPGAFRSGLDLVTLAPGARHVGTWGITIG